MRLERRRTTSAAGLLLIALLATACRGPPEPAAILPSPGGSATDQPVAATTPAPPAPPPPTAPTSSSPTPAPAPPTPANASLTTTVVATGLEAPWSLVFLPDGTALVSERDSGRVLAVEPGGGVREVQRLPSQGQGEGGLLGLAVSPDYASDGLVYAYYSTPEDNRIVRFRLGGEPEPILTGIPVGRIHNGGRLAFGPDRLLYATTGDSSERSLAQDLGSLGGKILRLTPDGAVPEGNPFPGSLVYSLGHRNVQGLAWTADGQLYATEFGQTTYDEVNRILPGGNYGWPEIEGPGGAPEYQEPLTVFSTAEASPSGATALVGGAIPQWEGDVFLAGLRGRRLWRLRLTPEGSLLEREPLLEGQAGRLRTVTQAPDGSLWILTSNRDGRGNPAEDDDRVLRLGPP